MKASFCYCEATSLVVHNVRLDQQMRELPLPPEQHIVIIEPPTHSYIRQDPIINTRTACYLETVLQW